MTQTFEERIWTAINEINIAIADLKAALKHPDPAHCTYVEQIRKNTAAIDNIKEQLAQMQTFKTTTDEQLKTLHEINDQLHTLMTFKTVAETGFKIALWVFGSGGVFNIAMFVYILFLIGKELTK